MRIAMARTLLWLAVFVMVGAAIAVAQQGSVPPAAARPPQLKLTIPGFSDGSVVAPPYTCADGPGVSPPMQWTNVPKGTLSYAVILHGSDVHPDKGMYDETFWLLWNVPGTATQIPQSLPATNHLPDGSEQANGALKIAGYRAPCPPSGSGLHHYIYEIYALDQTLNLTPDATRADIMKAMDGHILGSSAYVGVFQR